MNDKTNLPVSESTDATNQTIQEVFKNPPSLADLKRDYEGAKIETDIQIKKVQDWIDCFAAAGSYKAPDIQGRSKVVTKLVRKQVEWRCPSLTEPFLSNPKLIKIEPRSYEDVRAARQNELLLNYQLKNRINLVNLMDSVVRTAAIEGTAILKTYWNRKVDVAKKTEIDYEIIEGSENNPQLAQQYQELATKIQEDPSYITVLPEEVKIGLEMFNQGIVVQYRASEERTIEEERVTANHPDVELCDIDDVFVDPTCKGDLKKAKFIVYRFDTCMSELRLDKRYKNLDVLNERISSKNNRTDTKSTNTKSGGYQFEDEARKIIEAFEYWGYYDIDNDGILHSMVATWVDDVLIRFERNPFPDNRFPFVFIPLIPVKGSVYGEPDAELLKENQQIMSATFRGMIDLFGRSANGQTGFAKNFLDSTNLIRFNNGENYNFNPGVEPNRGIYEHKFPEIPASAFNMISYLNNDAESFSGVKAFSSGVTGDSLGKSGRLAKTVMDATAIRDTSILRRLAQGIVEMCYKFQSMNAEFLTSEDVFRLTNKEFVQVDKENLSGDFDLDIDIATAEADLAKAQDLAFLLQTGQNSFPFNIVQRIMAEIARLKKMPELEQYLLEYKPEPDPFADKMKELEMAKMDAEIALLQAQAAEARYKAEVHARETVVREARAKSIESQTDAKNVQTFKEVNGINQQEKLDLNKQAAENNLAVKIAENEAKKESAKQDFNLGIRREAALMDLQSNQEAVNPEDTMM